MTNKQQERDGRKDGEFGHGGLSEEQKREARAKGGRNSHSGRDSNDNKNS